MSTVRRKFAFVAAALCIAFLPAGALPQGIDLGDITGGGDGTGNKPAENIGIDPGMGTFVTAPNAATISEALGGDGLNPSSTTSQYIDSVFFIGPNEDPPLDPFPQEITQSGIQFEFPQADAVGTGWNYIMSQQGGGGFVPILVGEIDTWTTAVGIHASMGITYDLFAIRETHGEASVGCFSTVWGVDNCSTADVNLYVIFSSDADGIISQRVFSSAKVNAGELLRVDVPGNAAYMTLACGSNGVDACDHGTFARPRITAGTCPTTFNTQTVEVRPATATLGTSGSLQLTVRGLDDEGSPRTITSAASGTTYSVDPAGVVSVSADGLVTAIAIGTATVTATNRGVSGTATIDVQNIIILSDVVAGGNGSGIAPAENLGIDPRNGNYVTTLYDGGITDTDGVNPSAAASQFIDSVFFITAAGSAITMSGTEYPFQAIDRIGTGWNYILKDRDAGDGNAPMLVGGLNTWGSGIGIHASTGVTFDLAQLRAEHGASSVGCFSATLGMDDCTGDVILYAILSNDAEIIDSRTFRATQNSASYAVMTIPEDADYLTLATGSNGADGCDHGNFAEPVIISGTCVLPPLATFAVTPKSSVLAPGATVQLRVSATLENGFATDLTPGSTGTVYSAAPANFVTISENGLVTAVANGKTTVTITNGAFSDTVIVNVQDYIDLGNIVAGGNGKLPPPEGNIGINADTGVFVLARTNADVPEANGANPQPLDGSNGSANSGLIDSVFIMDIGVGQTITSEGAIFDFAAGDANTVGWEAILNAREPGGPDDLSFGTFGPITTGIGCHASQGVTFDLSGLGSVRGIHGDANVKYVSAIAGEASGQAGGSVNCYIILSDGVDILDSAQVLNAADSGEFIQLEIPAEAGYLTFAVGAAGNGIGGDHGAFGLAAITAKPVDVTNISKLDAYPPFAKLDSAAQLQLVLKGTMAAEGYVGARTTIPPSLATFSSGNTSVATVDASGLITAGAAGEAEITVTVGAQSAKVTVIVGEALSLSDVTRGGDGSGNAPVENFGIDPRNGAFVQVAAAGTPGTIQETDAEGDSLNPSPGASAFIDSVFIIGPNEDPPADPFPQGITQDGLTFDFPAADVIGTGYNYTFGNLGADATPLNVGGYGPFATGMGMHASTGITYDLAQLRSAHGSQAVGKLVAYWGTDGCATADVNLYAILASASAIVGQATFPGALANAGQLLELEIPATADYLTLAVGSNGVDACDHGHIAEAWILPSGGTERPVFYRADPNNDGQANITDGIYILNYLFLGGPAPTCKESADPNNDGLINITDGIYVLNYLFLGGPSPLPPGPPGKGLPCGTDTDPLGSPRDLGCDVYTKC